MREQVSIDYRYGGMEGAKILLIENDLSSAEGLASLLEKWGCDVAVTISKTEALERIRALDGIPDAIIADLHLDNNETGIEAIGMICDADQVGRSGDHRYRRLLGQGRRRRFRPWP